MRFVARTGLVAAAVCVVAAVAGGLAEGAGASQAAPVKCATLAANVKGVGTVTNCTDSPNTGGSGKLVFNVTKLTGTVTWNKTGTTTMKIAFTTPKVDEAEPPTHSCAKGSTEIVVTGVVTGGTGVAAKSILKGSKVSGEVCYTKTSVTNELFSPFII